MFLGQFGLMNMHVLYDDDIFQGISQQKINDFPGDLTDTSAKTKSRTAGCVCVRMAETKTLAVTAGSDCVFKIKSNIFGKNFDTRNTSIL